jgi:hypothetical protein
MSYDINTIVQSILYAPSFSVEHAEQRQVAAQDRYKTNLARILLDPTGE